MNLKNFDLELNSDINDLIIDSFKTGYNHLIKELETLKKFLSNELLFNMFNDLLESDNDILLSRIINFRHKYKDYLR